MPDDQQPTTAQAPTPDGEPADVADFTLVHLSDTHLTSGRRPLQRGDRRRRGARLGGRRDPPRAVQRAPDRRGRRVRRPDRHRRPGRLPPAPGSAGAARRAADLRDRQPRRAQGVPFRTARYRPGPSNRCRPSGWPTGCASWSWTARSPLRRQRPARTRDLDNARRDPGHPRAGRHRRRAAPRADPAADAAAHLLRAGTRLPQRPGRRDRRHRRAAGAGRAPPPRAERHRSAACRSPSPGPPRSAPTRSAHSGTSAPPGPARSTWSGCFRAPTPSRSSRSTVRSRCSTWTRRAAPRSSAATPPADRNQRAQTKKVTGSTRASQQPVSSAGPNGIEERIVARRSTTAATAARAPMTNPATTASTSIDQEK